MASGMAEFVNKDLGQGTTTMDEYNGIAIVVLWPGMGNEMMHLNDQMGLFLQKTNILRDYLEDSVDGRAFWPMEVWKKYVPTTTSGGVGGGGCGGDGESPPTPNRNSPKYSTCRKLWRLYNYCM